ncbi:MAG: alkaline shock response membrane anchor protein AmaP [Fusobacterium sp.]|nr:alkaline shock response membrane anchor protein AmaP [Fusobacterium sp.]
MVNKIVFFFAWLGIFILSVLGINFILLPGEFAFSSNAISLERFSLFDLKMVVVAICVVYILLCIYRVISLFERKKEYVKKTENGVIKISNATINSYVVEFLKKDSDIGKVKVTSGGSSKNFCVRVKMQILHQLNIAEKISEVQNKVKENLNESLGIEVKDVLISISNISTKEKVNKAEAN